MKTEKIPEILDESLIEKLLPRHDCWSDKRQIGEAILIAGCKRMTGAAALASLGALRSGIGLLTLAVPESIAFILQIKLNEPVFLPLEDARSGYFTKDSCRGLEKSLEYAKALAVGPGISTENSVDDFFIALLPKIKIPCVFDADALNILSKNISLLKQIKTPKILTPHVREYERLFGKLPVSDSKISEQLIQNAREFDCIILLKGAPIRVVTPDGRIFKWEKPNLGMAKGGSGDVLTGIILSMLAQGKDALSATILGILLHQKAGQIARNRFGSAAMLPSDIAGNILQDC